jgi:hypothetical protein
MMTKKSSKFLDTPWALAHPKIGRHEISLLYLQITAVATGGDGVTEKVSEWLKKL